MKTVLVGPDIEENLALGYLGSAIRQAGHECSIVAFNRSQDVGKAGRTILRLNPGLVGLSLVAQRRYPEFQALASTLRRKGYRGHLTAGGHFASLRATEVLRDTPGIDSVLHHDGEQRIVDLLRVLSGERALPGPLDGVTWRRPDGTLDHRPAVHVPDVDSLPFPVRRRPDRALGYARAPIVSSRGCAGSCSFCSIHAWHKQVPGRRLRFRSPAGVAEEMISLHRDHRVRVFIFHDDDFIHPDARRALDRCRRILDQAQDGIGEPFAFVIKCRPDDVDERLFRYLKSRGLARTYVGIETHARAGIATLNRRVSPQTNLRALGTLRDLGIYCCFNLLLFHPETSIAELEENLDFLRQHTGHPFDVARTELYARSGLEDRLVREGRAIGDYRGYDYRIAAPRAEAVFQLFARVLWDRHFGGSSILHRVQDLGFRLSLLERFHPELASAELATRVASLIRDVNSDTVDYVSELIGMAAVPEMTRVPASRPAGTAAASGPGGAAAIREMTEAVRRRTQHQTARWMALTLEMESRALLARAGVSALPPLARLPRLLGNLVGASPGLALLLGTFSCTGSTVCDPPPPPAVRFARDIEPTLVGTCGVAGCHGAETAAAGLVLAGGAAYTNLVGVPSTQVPRLKRVEPAESDSSYLVNKLEGTQATVGGTGNRMPPGLPRDAGFSAAVWRWIEKGAEKN